MTVLGIAGCTALLVTGFGIKDSIQMIVSGQYGELLKYDMEISISNKTTDSNIKDMASKLNKSKNINTKIIISTILVILKELDKLSQLVKLNEKAQI